MHLNNRTIYLHISSFVALRYNSFVVVGFPLKEYLTANEDSETEANESLEKYYNAQALVDRRGRLLHLYRKHFLYETDEQWANEGPQFEAVRIEELRVTVGFGICMDVNPYKFQAPFDLYEFATFHRDHGTQLLLCSMNWLTHENRPFIKDRNSYNDTVATADDIADEPAERGDQELLFTEQNLRYWFVRLSKLIGTECYTVISNRIGNEMGTIFCGNSCILDLQSPKVLGWLDRTQEALLIRQIDFIER